MSHYCIHSTIDEGHEKSKNYLKPACTPCNPNKMKVSFSLEFLSFILNKQSDDITVQVQQQL